RAGLLSRYRVREYSGHWRMAGWRRAGVLSGHRVREYSNHWRMAGWRRASVLSRHRMRQWAVQWAVHCRFQGWNWADLLAWFTMCINTQSFGAVKSPKRSSMLVGDGMLK